MEFVVRAATLDLWPALEELFSDGASCRRCWCMYWRIGPAYRRRPPEENRRALRDIVREGPSPGLLAFVNDVPVGWCQVTPRASLPHLDRTAAVRRVDDLPVWSVSCFYVRKGFRQQGATSALLSEALKVAKRAGAPALEAYPLDAGLSTSASFTGYASTFARAGFVIAARHQRPRPIMRHDLHGIAL